MMRSAIESYLQRMIKFSSRHGLATREHNHEWLKVGANLFQSLARGAHDELDFRVADDKRRRYHHRIAARLPRHPGSRIEEEPPPDRRSEHAISELLFRCKRHSGRFVMDQLDPPEHPAAADVADHRVTRQFFLD